MVEMSADNTHTEQSALASQPYAVIQLSALATGFGLIATGLKGPVRMRYPGNWPMLPSIEQGRAGNDAFSRLSEHIRHFLNTTAGVRSHP
jgi:hypothetical protein